MIKTYKNINIWVGYQHFCMKPSEQAHFSKPVKWVQIVVCYDWNLQKHKYLGGISMCLHKTFRTGLIFLSRSKWVQIVVCYNRTYKNINISVGYQCFCMKPSEQGLFFWASWNKSKEWYANQNLQKHKYLRYQRFCMKPSEQGWSR